MTLLDNFPNHMQPRDLQISALTDLQEKWSKANVLVLDIPTGGGKSAIAMSIANYSKNTAIITPTKMLVDQYGEEYKDTSSLHIMRAKSDHTCTNFDCPLTERPKDQHGLLICGEHTPYCPGCEGYLEAKERCQTADIVCGNYFTYLAYGMYRDTLIVDEAHKLIEAVRQMAGRRIWKHQVNYPGTVRTRDDLREWLKDRPELPHVHPSIYRDLEARRPSYLFNKTMEKYRGVDKECINMIPLDVDTAPPFFWPSSVQKIILMSATINRKDIEELGLSRNQVAYVSETSPILKNRRPVVAPALGGINMSMRHVDSSLPQFIKACQELLLRHKGEKGLIHCSYGLASKIKGYWQDDRLVYHTKKDKMAKYNMFRESKVEEGKCLVASGMYEGIDLPYEYGRWQIIAKVPWPYLGEPAVKFKAEIDPEYYVWETVKTLLQACGRIVRTPTDYGITYILDDTFKRLYNDHTYLFPKWFQQSVRFLDTAEWNNYDELLGKNRKEQVKYG